MKSSVIRTAVIASVITALAVTALGFVVVPRLMHPKSPMDNLSMQPAMYNGANTAPASDSAAPAATEQRAYNDRPARAASARRAHRVAGSYSEPVRHRRSTAKSALIVAGSAGTGAAIGGIAGGGKGAAIGAIAGGVGGLIYDRATANK